MNWNTVTNNAKNSSHPILIGLIYTIGVVMISSLIFALLLYFTSLSDSYLPVVSYSITVVSLLIGGNMAGRKAGTKGWYYGGSIGLIYGVILVIISFLAFEKGINLNSIVLIVLTFLFGAFGGIFGVNLKK